MSTVSEREVGGERPLVGDTVRLWAVVSRRRHVGHPGVCLSACTACVRGHFQAQGCRCFCSRASKEEPISTLAGSYPWLGELGLAYHSHGYGEACGSVRLATWNADLCLSFLSFSLATGYHGWNNEASYPAARPHSCFLGDGALSPLSLRMWASSVPDADQRGCVQVKVECGLRLGNGCASCGSAKGGGTGVHSSLAFVRKHIQNVKGRCSKPWALHVEVDLMYRFGDDARYSQKECSPPTSAHSSGRTGC